LRRAGLTDKATPVFSTHIAAPDGQIISLRQQKIDRKTKPTGSLGPFEALALKIGPVQQSLTPRLVKPQIVLCQ